MRISAKCSVAVHILIMLAAFPERKLTGNFIARSVGCNPVVARGLISRLKKAGLVDVQRGSGGAALACDPAQVTLWDIYLAAEDTPPATIIALHPAPSLTCSVGRNIYKVLKGPYGRVAQAVEATMKTIALSDMIADYRAAASLEPH